ncbi:UDP-glucose 4-epimerase [Vibrio thalassae]|uniref:UDP-glucose 4-epimerase n=1 Tax=Vibrio thalassae TaxID=1243014 RepID=A0A240EI49_9VIBR|nr:NAD-dependent epimerase/dehydratase family protein [Vibrio thalassae]SNX47859.1 UDP-glucose 4-epimerase [Vibrio thalassae]
MKVLVIGGSGFIGTRLLDLLCQIPDLEVLNYDKVLSASYPKISIVGDIRDLDSLTKACSGIDVIYNLAAEHADNVLPLSLYNDVNVIGAKNVVDAAISNNVGKIIFTSTVAIYGLNRGTPNESFEPQPFNEYGFSKFRAEKVLNHWCSENSSRSLVTVRPAVVFGENNRGNVYNLIKQIVTGRFIMIGNGNNLKSMSYVGNVAAFLAKQLEVGAGHYVYNYADKDDLCSAQIVSIVRNEMNLGPSKLRIPYAIGLVGGYAFDILSKVTGKKYPISSVRIRKFCSDTTVDSSTAMSSGFAPPYSLEDGLRRMINHEFK